MIQSKETVLEDSKTTVQRRNKRVMDVKEMAKYLGLCLNTAYWLLHVEGFPAVKFGRRYLVTEDALVDWLNSHQGESLDIWKRN